MRRIRLRSNSSKFVSALSCQGFRSESELLTGPNYDEIAKLYNDCVTGRFSYESVESFSSIGRIGGLVGYLLLDFLVRAGAS